jgi:hypothetical protein
LRDKPFRNFARCKHCGKAKNQHRAFTLECPAGKRSPSGYLRFSVQRFLEMRGGQPTESSPADVDDRPPKTD